ncbi:hypothetical protein Hprae_1114 [Halanaerobium praevalens DSM 2228]|uniref:Uncharacterized protein n=2 Tax=Halanaerobium praevalens TaxID=2331 RepID=E3DLR8_HALPG|nr:hypothetical protein Hprae_1114 [Halanaerobium praevalens DSM 2228]
MEVIDFKKYLKKYDQTTGLYPKKLKQIGKKYHAQSYLTRAELYQLAHLNSTRSSYHVKRNPINRVKKVTKAAYKLEDIFCKLALYTSLMGVGIPTASAILTALDPQKHCVIDTRVWATLYQLNYFEQEKESFKADDYFEIIKIVRKMAAQTNFSPSQIGYALFAYDVLNREGNLHS